MAVVSACASAEKKSCETRDWYEFGKSVALEGGSVENSPVVDQCKGLGVAVDGAKMNAGFSAGKGEYCQVATFEKATEMGDSRSVLKCPENLRSALEQAQARGLKKHCTRNGAFSRGKLGKPNLNVCPENLRKSYASYFSMGRIAYLKGESLKLERRKVEIERRNVAIEKEIAEHEKNKARYAELRDQKNSTAVETLSYLSMSNPETAIKDLNSEKENLKRESDELTNRMIDLKGEIQTLELEAPESNPVSGPLDQES